MKYLSALFMIALMWCCVPTDFIPKVDAGPGECYNRVNASFHGDPSFTPDEQAAIHEAMARLLAFSEGRINFVTTFDLDLNNPREPFIRRATATDPEVLQVEADAAKRSGLPSFTIFGVARKNPTRVLLVTERVASNQVANLATHELGHVAGFEWPDCNSSKQDCKHSPDESALMAARFSGNRLGPADLEFCRASCLCP